MSDPWGGSIELHQHQTWSPRGIRVRLPADRRPSPRSPSLSSSSWSDRRRLCAARWRRSPRRGTQAIASLRLLGPGPVRDPERRHRDCGARDAGAVDAGVLVHARGAHAGWDEAQISADFRDPLPVSSVVADINRVLAPMGWHYRATRTGPGQGPIPHWMHAEPHGKAANAFAFQTPAGSTSWIMTASWQPHWPEGQQLVRPVVADLYSRGRRRAGQPARRAITVRRRWRRRRWVQLERSSCHPICEG